MNVDSDLPIQEGLASTAKGPRRSSRKAHPNLRNRPTTSTGSSARVRPLAVRPKPGGDVFEDPVQEDLPAITINQQKSFASQSKAKNDRPRRCTFCKSRRQKCVPQEPNSCRACVQRGLECRDWREVSKNDNFKVCDTFDRHPPLERCLSKGEQKGNEQGNKTTMEQCPSTTPSAPQQSDIRKALLQSFRAGPSAAETSQEYSSNMSDQPHGNVALETGQQNPIKTAARLGLSQRHGDTSLQRIHRVTFDIPSERSPLPYREVDASVEMSTGRNTHTERAPSFEIMTEAEYQASLQFQHHSSGMTFKKEPTDDNNDIGLRMDNIGCFLGSLGLEHWISNFHDVGLKSREHLKKLVDKVNDKERMDELWRMLQLQKVPITVWWDVLDGLSKAAANHL